MLSPEEKARRQRERYARVKGTFPSLYEKVCAFASTCGAPTEVAAKIEDFCMSIIVEVLDD